MRQAILTLIVIGIVLCAVSVQAKEYKSVTSCAVLHTDGEGNPVPCPGYGTGDENAVIIEYPNGVRELINTGIDAHNGTEQLQRGQLILLRRINELERKLDSIISDNNEFKRKINISIEGLRDIKKLTEVK
jgi:hypothetical protein